MDHSYPEKFCKHGGCVNHGPEWDATVKSEPRYEPRPTLILRRKRYLLEACCDQGMKRLWEVVECSQRCRRCGRTRQWRERRAVRRCECCGYQTVPLVTRSALGHDWDIVGDF